MHVLDDVTLELLLGELDTVTDFLDYLEEKEDFIRADRLYKAFGEENLLAWYLQRMKEDGSRHHIYCPAGKQLQLKPTQWSEFYSSKERALRKDADSVSYAWDALIEEFSRHLFDGSLETDEPRSPSEIEQGLRVMAKERRLGRRSLGGAMAGAMHTESGAKAFVRTILSTKNSHLAYVFAVCPKNDIDEKTYSEMRRKYLSDYCFVLTWRLRQLTTVVGVATQTLKSGENRNFDMVVQKSPDWNEENEEAAAEIKSAWGFQSEDAISSWEKTEYEYPDEAKNCAKVKFSNAQAGITRQGGRIGRNQSCPCRSGKKFKRCCGSR